MLTAMNKLRACLFLFSSLVIPAASGQISSPPRAGSTYVGSDTCQPCHDDIYKTIAESAHQKLLGDHDRAQRGCEACHGPGSAHVNGNGDASKIFRFREVSAEVVRSRCGECHQSLMGQDARHQRLSCLACHSAHHYQEKKFLLTFGKEQLCQQCH
jgi:predicted CXXCH cytochrome family protein